LQGLRFVAQAGIDEGDVEWRNIAALSELAQIRPYRQCLLALSRHSIGVTQGSPRVGIAPREIERLLELGNGFPIHGLLLVRQYEPPVPRGEVRIHLERLSKMLDGFIVAAGAVQLLAQTRADNHR